MTFLEFCHSTMPDRFSQPSTSEQLHYMHAIEGAINAGEVRELSSLPRGQGTTTIMLAAACWCLTVRREPFVVIYGPDSENMLMSITDLLDVDHLAVRNRHRKPFIRIHHPDGTESLCAMFDRVSNVRGLCEEINGKSQRPTVLLVGEQNYKNRSLNAQDIKRLKAVVPIGATVISRIPGKPEKLDSVREYEDEECVRDEWEIEWERFQQTDALVRGGKQSGASDAQIACALARMNRALVDRLMRLEAIAPRKIQLPDGTVIVWRCPDELVPASVS